MIYYLPLAQVCSLCPIHNSQFSPRPTCPTRPTCRTRPTRPTSPNCLTRPTSPIIARVAHTV